ncbi:MAG: tyrosine--tRNA ligase [Nitrospinota bacterium]
MGELERQLAHITRGTVEVIQREELVAKLRRRKPLRVKCGFDPTAPDLHLGHTVLMHKLRHFQELGHEVIFLIGDFTGLIGDPTGQSETRPPLKREELERNAETYRRQAFKILDEKKTRMEFNSRWLSSLSGEDLVRLASRMTVARMLERDDFQKRYGEGQPISLHEFLYPLLQGYDSVALEADVELGGTDQKFNLLVGRELQRDWGQEPQVVITLPLLPGTDGVLKMSKSFGNHIGIDEPPEEIYGKVMSIGDELMLHYYELLSEAPAEELEEMRRAMAAGRMNPRDAKARLALELTRRYWGSAAAEAAALRFNQVHRERQVPDEVSEPALEVRTRTAGRVWLAALLVAAGLAKSHAEARRLIRGGGVRVDGERVKDEELELRADREHLLQVGKRRFVRIKPEKLTLLPAAESQP